MLHRSREETEDALRKQLKMLASSCAAYDKGETWEHVRLATTVYVLVRNGGRNNKSLLAQLGLKENIKFVASGLESNPRNILPEMLLVDRL